jgi:hypothetical protein
VRRRQGVEINPGQWLPIVKAAAEVMATVPTLPIARIAVPLLGALIDVRAS